MAIKEPPGSNRASFEDEQMATMAPAVETFDGGKPMTLLEHLQELRGRLIWCALALVAGVIVSSIITNDVMRFFLDQAKAEAPQLILVYGAPMENVATFFRVALMLGLILAMPVFVYHVLMFVLPALMPNEKRWVLGLGAGMVIAFLIGIAFSYNFILPPSSRVLFNFNTDIAAPYIQVGKYFDFVTRLLFWVGLTFEMPIFILALARFGVVTGRRLLGWWRFALVGAFVLSAFITPTIDPVTQTLVAGPIIVLWLIGTGLAFVFGRPRVA